jgi:hypothetical protein
MIKFKKIAMLPPTVCLHKIVNADSSFRLSVSALRSWMEKFRPTMRNQPRKSALMMLPSMARGVLVWLTEVSSATWAAVS